MHNPNGASHKTCTCCKQLVPTTHFYKKLNGLQPKCKKCTDEFSKKYEAENKIKRQEYRHIKYLRNKEKVKENAKRWAINNPEKRLKIACAYQKKRMDMIRSNGGHITKSRFIEIRKTANGKCTYCGVDSFIQMDHFIPVTRGGRTEAGNLVPSCIKCNREKGAEDPWKWVREKVSEENQQKIKQYLELK